MEARDSQIMDTITLEIPRSDKTVLSALAQRMGWHIKTHPMSKEEFWSRYSAWKEDGETAEETIEKIRNARCSGVTRHIESFDD